MSNSLSTRHKGNTKIKPITKFHDLLRSSLLPRLETEILVSFLLKKPRVQLLAHPETPINSVVLKTFQTLTAKRLKNWPLAYLTGQQGFYGLNFKVKPSILIPRPETEMIVDEIMEIMKNINSNKHSSLKKNTQTKKPDRSKNNPAQANIIDIGTGSGAIIIASAATAKKLFPSLFKNTSFYALDISPQALKIARQNAKSHHLAQKIKFYHSDLLEALKKKLLTIQKSSQNLKAPTPLIISANLPYLTTAQIKNSPTISREPKLALLGGHDGLKYYRRLIKQIYPLHLNLALTILCEINPMQAKPLSKIFKQYWSDAKIIIKKDLAGKERILKVHF